MSPRAKPPTKATTTNTPSTVAREVSSSAPVGPWSVRSPISRENRPKAANAASSPFLSAAAISAAGFAWVSAAIATADPDGSDLLDFRSAENAGGQEDQDHDEDRKRRNVLVLDGKIGGPEGLDQADEEAAEHGARQRADAAKDRGGERLDAGDEADEEIDHAVIEQVHDAGDRGERGADHEGERDGAVGIDAQQRRHFQVLLAGAHVAAEPRAGDEPGEDRHQRQRYEHDDDLNVGDLHREGLALEQRIAAGDQRRQRLDPGALGDLHVVLQDDRHADRRDERRQAEGMAQRPVGDALDHLAVQRGERHRDQQHQEQGNRNGGDTDRHQQQKGDQSGEGSDHENIAVGEIDHADDAIDHGVADGDEAVDRAERKAVDELLAEIFHASAAPPRERAHFRAVTKS